MAGKAEPALFTHTVASDNINVIFRGSNRRRMLPGVGAERPVGRDGENLSALQFEHATGFGETAIVANADADLPLRCGEDGERLVSQRRVPVNAQAGKMQFTIRSQNALRRD